MSKIDELAALFRRSRNAYSPYTDGGYEGDRAGIAAVVRALRDEIVEDGNCKYCVATTAMYNEILGAAGDEVAGQDTAETPEAIERSTPATAPAPAVCEWIRDFDPFCWTACSGEQRIEKGMVDCPSCGKPIKFTEAKT